jgi:hypothetical protein
MPITLPTEGAQIGVRLSASEGASLDVLIRHAERMAGLAAGTLTRPAFIRSLVVNQIEETIEKMADQSPGLVAELVALRPQVTERVTNSAEALANMAPEGHAPARGRNAIIIPASRTTVTHPRSTVRRTGAGIVISRGGPKK